MATRSVAIGSSAGLHIRPAALLAHAVNAAGLPVTIAKEGDSPVDAGSILAVMSLGARHGEIVTLVAEDEAAETVLDELATLLARDLDAR